MNTIEELTEIWHLLKQHEIRLIELDRRMQALLSVLKTQSSLFDAYQATYTQIGRSNVILQQEPTVLAIDEKLRQLSILG